MGGISIDSGQQKAFQDRIARLEQSRGIVTPQVAQDPKPAERDMSALRSTSSAKRSGGMGKMIAFAIVCVILIPAVVFFATLSLQNF